MDLDPKARARPWPTDLESSWERHVLPSGLTVVLETVPTVSSLAIGLWVRTGTRDEADPVAGIAHFVEHLVFKGTERRDTYEIARALESVGGELDAFTGREATCFYARVLSEHLPLAVDVLADLTCHPLLTAEEVDKEKKVIVDEIRSFEDNPEDVVHESFSGQLWQGHPLGRPILGTESSIQALTPEVIREWFRAHYTAPNMVVAVAGALDPDELLALVDRHVVAPGGPPPRRVDLLPEPPRGLRPAIKDLSQEHVVLGQRTVSYRDPDRFAVNLLSTLLGGGMSSRLFQAIREREGLSYSVYSFTDLHRDAGVFGSALGCSPGETQRALDVLVGEYRGLLAEGLRPGELDSAREQLKGGLLLGLESMSNRMSQLARAEMAYGRRVPVEELLGAIEAVHEPDVLRMAAGLLDPERTLVAALGPCRDLAWNGRQP
ncbi:MAG TPA: pitrilysin family protein [Candidatus Saccharimonadales bacterium]|nr:pitrilysin family protein [Candidatus Saccharimonadales bacterium]